MCSCQRSRCSRHGSYRSCAIRRSNLEQCEVKPNYARAQYAIGKAYIQIADTFKDEKKTLDEELTKLRQLDPALAQELEEYRKKYVGGIIAGPPVKVDQ